jgi:hypothetical protein
VIVKKPAIKKPDATVHRAIWQLLGDQYQKYDCGSGYWFYRRSAFGAAAQYETRRKGCR